MSFRAKLVLGIGFIQAAVVAGLLWTSLSFLERSRAAQVEAQAARTAALAAAIAKDWLLAPDVAALDDLVRALSQSPEVVYVRVRAEDGSVLAQGGDVAAVARPFGADGQFQQLSHGVLNVTAALREGDLSLGQVELGFSGARVGLLARTSRRDALMIAALGMALVALFLVWIGAYLTRLVPRLGGVAPHAATATVLAWPLAEKVLDDAPMLASIPAQPTVRGRILLVEDGAVNQMVAAAMLRKAGYGVDAVADGRQAVQAVEKGHYDAILMDMGLPEMDGTEATKAIRALPGERGGMPIIALTASSFEGDWERCLASGMNDVLAKPIDAAALHRTLSRWIPSEAGVPAPAPGATAADIDEEALQRLGAEAGPDAMPAIIRVFLKELQCRLQCIVEAARAADYGMMRDQAHVLKSSAGTFGAVRLYRLANELDQACKQGELRRAEALAERLPEEAARAREALASRFPEVTG